MAKQIIKNITTTSSLVDGLAFDAGQIQNTMQRFQQGYQPRQIKEIREEHEERLRLRERLGKWIETIATSGPVDPEAAFQEILRKHLQVLPEDQTDYEFKSGVRKEGNEIKYYYYDQKSSSPYFTNNSELDRRREKNRGKLLADTLGITMRDHTDESSWQDRAFITFEFDIRELQEKLAPILSAPSAEEREKALKALWEQRDKAELAQFSREGGAPKRFAKDLDETVTQVEALLRGMQTSIEDYKKGCGY